MKTVIKWLGDPLDSATHKEHVGILFEDSSPISYSQIKKFKKERKIDGRYKAFFACANGWAEPKEDMLELTTEGRKELGIQFTLAKTSHSGEATEGDVPTEDEMRRFANEHEHFVGQKTVDPPVLFKAFAEYAERNDRRLHPNWESLFMKKLKK